MEEAVIKRIPPHNIEAERAVIGSMIMDRDAILVCSEIDRKSTRLNSSHTQKSRMPSSA